MGHTSLLPIKPCGGYCLAPVSSPLPLFSPAGVIRAQSPSALQPLLSSRLAGDPNVLPHPRLPPKVSKSPSLGSLMISTVHDCKEELTLSLQGPSTVSVPGGRAAHLPENPSTSALAWPSACRGEAAPLSQCWVHSRCSGNKVPLMFHTSEKAFPFSILYHPLKRHHPELGKEALPTPTKWMRKLRREGRGDGKREELSKVPVAGAEASVREVSVAARAQAARGSSFQSSLRPRALTHVDDPSSLP